MHVGENLARLTVELILVKEHAQSPRRFAPDEDILGNCQVIHQLQFLMNYPDAHHLSGAWAGEIDRLALIENFSAIPGVDTCEDFHQSRFTGAVLADEGMDLPGEQLEADVAQRADAGKILANVLHGYEWGHCPSDQGVFLAGSMVGSPDSRRRSCPARVISHFFTSGTVERSQLGGRVPGSRRHPAYHDQQRRQSSLCRFLLAARDLIILIVYFDQLRRRKG
jgi:hypothetical protein